jgi:hypothetical protein
MTDSPTFSKIDADRILRRAAELEGTEDARRLTVEELRSIAGEAGFGPRAVERAIAEVRRAEPPEVRRPPVQKWGLLVTHLSALREVPVGIDSEQLMRAVRLFQPYRDGPAHVKLEEHEVTWHDRRGIRFTLGSVGGVTQIRVYVSKLLLRRGRWMGWVRTAADRLETLVLLVAERDADEPRGVPRLPPPSSSQARLES